MSGLRGGAAFAFLQAPVFLEWYSSMECSTAMVSVSFVCDASLIRLFNRSSMLPVDTRKE